MALSGYDFQMVKREMLKYEKIDPRELAKRPKRSSRMEKGCRVFYKFPFDPRVPHPRKLISRNYEILARNPTAKALFPRSNLIASGKRLPNLGEILSPTVQPPKPRNIGDHPAGGQGGPDLPANRGGRAGRDRRQGRHQEGSGAGQGGDEPEQPASGQASTPFPTQASQQNGTYHCEYHKRSHKCDLCSHITERRTVFSSHFMRYHAVAGHNIHRKATEVPKLMWFIYLEECIHNDGIFQYVGSTISMTERWANTKNRCLAGDSDSTGLYKHYKEGCSARLPALGNIRVSLLEHYTTTTDALTKAKHKPGPACNCVECDKLKQLESKWILRLGTIHGQYGLNMKSELSRKARASF